MVALYGVKLTRLELCLPEFPSLYGSGLGLTHLAVSAALQGPPAHLLQLLSPVPSATPWQRVPASFSCRSPVSLRLKAVRARYRFQFVLPGASTPLPSPTSCPPAQLSTVASGPTSDAEVTALHRLYLSGTQNDKATAPTVVEVPSP